jgi:glutathione peroxidase
MAKADVNGADRLSLYETLCQTADADGHEGDIRWNFEKFIIEGDGTVARFSSRVKPEALGL